MREMISFGAGVNSVAMTIMLVEDGWRGPIVFADTGSEIPETYCYIDYFEKAYLRVKNLRVERLSPATHPSFYGTREVTAGTLEQFCINRQLIPLLAARWCTREWKVRPSNRWRVEHGITVGLVGICADEPSRVRHGDPGNRYPLVERGIGRQACRRLIQEAGLIAPPKSSCFFCPGASVGHYKRLYYDHPALFERARFLEQLATKKRGKLTTLKIDYSLDELEARGWDIQTEMDLSQWLPCACRL